MISTTSSHEHSTRAKRSAQHLGLARSDLLVELVWSWTDKKIIKFKKFLFNTMKISLTYKNFGVWPSSVTYSQKETEPSELVEARYRTEPLSAGQKLMEVIVPPWPVNTAICKTVNCCNKMSTEKWSLNSCTNALTGAVVRRHHTRTILSHDPAASSVLSQLTAKSAISADAPRKVANNRPVTTLHILINKSSAPYKY